jgi:hypothetical protein
VGFEGYRANGAVGQLGNLWSGIPFSHAFELLDVLVRPAPSHQSLPCQSIGKKWKAPKGGRCTRHFPSWPNLTAFSVPAMMPNKRQIGRLLLRGNPTTERLTTLTVQVSDGKSPFYGQQMA